VVLDIVDLVSIGLLIILVVLVAFLLRLALVRRGGATVDCGLRLPHPAGRWRLGLARYTADDLEWFRLVSVSYRPTWTFVRSSIEISGRRNPRGAELLAVPHGAVAITCNVITRQGDDLDVEFAISETAMTGFLAWIESSAPGAHIRPDTRV
jgi:hypothetical protein